MLPCIGAGPDISVVQDSTEIQPFAFEQHSGTPKME